MAPLRPYVPSMALIRALSRPPPLRCPLIRPQPVRSFWSRGKGKAKNVEISEIVQAPEKREAQAPQKRKAARGAQTDEGEWPTPEDLGPNPYPALRKATNNYENLNGFTYTKAELDLDTGEETTIAEYKTKEDFERMENLWNMYVQDMTDPNYDDAEYKKAMLDDMMRDPRWADIKPGLINLRKRVRNKEEQAIYDAEQKKKEEAAFERLKPDLDLLEADLMTYNHMAWSSLLDDPDLEPAHDTIREYISKMNTFTGADDPEKKAMETRVEEALESLPCWEEKLKQAPQLPEGITDDEADEVHAQWMFNYFASGGGDPKAVFNPGLIRREDGIMDEGVIKELKAYLANGYHNAIRTLLAVGTDKEFNKEVAQRIGMDWAEIEAYDPKAEHPDSYAGLLKTMDMVEEDDESDETFDFDELKAKIDKLNADGVPPPGAMVQYEPEVELLPEERDDPQLKATIDKLMDDPHIVEKVALIKQAFEQVQNDLTLRPIPSAPDPEELPKSELTSYAEKLKIAENDPEHVAGMRRLRIKLMPPFNVAPAVKHLNYALKLAYCGASDDVRRIIWRTYNKARAVPTLLQSIPDDAWDLIWYSQAVNWRSNQNRHHHLQMLLHDLKSVGRNGPPTHPDHLPID